MNVFGRACALKFMKKEDELTGGHEIFARKCTCSYARESRAEALRQNPRTMTSCLKTPDEALTTGKENPAKKYVCIDARESKTGAHAEPTLDQSPLQPRGGALTTGYGNLAKKCMCSDARESSKSK